IDIPAAPAAHATADWPTPRLLPIAAAQAPVAMDVRCAGAFAQGGIALCRTEPNATIRVDGVDRGQADRDGWAVIGFDRDAQPTTEAPSTTAAGERAPHPFTIMPRSFSIQRVDGLPPATVNPTDPAIIARIRREAELKATGFASRAGVEGWLDGFRWP